MSYHPVKEKLELFTKDTSSAENMDMSPVTNLALNMKCLTTSLTDTPSRSYSNPFPNENSLKSFVENLSPSLDSPTFQEISCRMKNKLKLRKASKKILSSNFEDGKENVAPPEDFISPDIDQEMCEDGVLKYDHQDSGYSDMTLKHFGVSFDSTPQLRRKSSVSVDEEGDGFETFFQMEEEDNESYFINMPDMTNLLTKPLYKGSKYKPMPERLSKIGRLPIRRCLSMEMENSSNSQISQFEVISQTGTVVAACSSTSSELESLKKCPFKRPDPPSCFEIQNKRRKSSPTVHLSKNFADGIDFTFHRSFSETAATIMHAVQQSDLNPDLIGDCSKSYALPLIKGQHQDLKCISSQTLVQLLEGYYSREIEGFSLVDCRYPYEFEGGHIQGAVNIYTKEGIQETFLKPPSSSLSGRNIIIFHCEFSSERAPNLCRFLRKKDREVNEYPKLHHPEIYLLEGGYKAFFHSFKEYCEPQGYKPMTHEDHGFELRHFRAKSKSWGNDTKSRSKLKQSAASDVL